MSKENKLPTMTQHPRLYELTQIDQTEGLESGEYIVVYKNGYPFITKYKTTDPDGWVELDKPTNFKHYLRPLPEGTEVLRPGDVAVSRDRLFELNAMVFELIKCQKLLARVSGLGILSNSYEQHEKEVEKVMTKLAGTQVLKPGEVAVTTDELFEFLLGLSNNDIMQMTKSVAARKEIAAQFIQTKLAQMGE